MDKIRYRLVYNRKNQLNRQGLALVQVEASLRGRKVYFRTDIYLRPEHWDKGRSQVYKHPQADGLNMMLYEFVLRLQGIELELWKRGMPVTLALLKDTMKKGQEPSISFLAFAKESIMCSDKRQSTKSNLLSTVKLLQDFRQGLDFKDLTYTFLREFEQFLRERGNGVNTIAKHMRQLRTLVNEAINCGYIHQDMYPFRMYKIKKEKGKHKYLAPSELRKLERLKPESLKLQHLLDVFLFCCYTGLRFSDFCRLTSESLVKINGKIWLCMKSLKTGSEIKLPLHLLFGGKALEILSRYEDVKRFVSIPRNSEVNHRLAQLAGMAGINKHFTFHTARHTCATLLIHQGVPITTVQKLLGHASVKTTEIYSEILSNTIVKDLKNVKIK